MNRTDEMLVEYLKLSGQWLIDHAEEVVGDTGNIYTAVGGASFFIRLNPDEVPTITSTRELMMDSVYCDFSRK